MKSDRVILTGGFGFIGRILLEKLIQETDFDVIVIDNGLPGLVLKKSDIQLFSNPRLSWNPVSALSDKDFLNHNVSGSIIIHLGAIASTDAGIPVSEMFTSNFAALIPLLESCEREGSRFIFASSAAVYGNSQSPDEVGFPSPINSYGLSKLKLEQLVSKYSNLDYVGLRLFNVYGLGEENKGHMKSLPAKMVEEHRMNGFINIYVEDTKNLTSIFECASRDLVHVQDVTTTILNLVERREKVHSSIYDLGTGYSTNVIDIAKMILTEDSSGEIRHSNYPGNWNSYQKFTRANLHSWESIPGVLMLENSKGGLQKYISDLLFQ